MTARYRRVLQIGLLLLLCAGSLWLLVWEFGTNNPAPALPARDLEPSTSEQGGDGTPTPQDGRTEISSVIRQVAVHVEADGTPISAGELRLSLSVGNDSRIVAVPGPVVNVDTSILQRGMVIHVVNRSGNQVTKDTVVWRGEQELRIPLRNEFPCEIKLVSEDGEKVSGTVYNRVVMTPRPRATDDHTVAIGQQGGRIQVDVSSPDHRIVCYARGFVPSAIHVGDLPGYPWNLSEAYFRLEVGASVYGEVVDQNNKSVGNQEVLVKSFYEMDGGQERALLSFGPAFSRITKGIWETLTTNADGTFRVTGIGQEVRALSCRVLGERVQVSPSPGTVMDRVSGDIQMHLIVR